MKPSTAIRAHRAAIHEVVRRHHASNPRVFGSVARGEDTELSDLDLLIDPEPGMTLMDIGAMAHELQTMLGVSVDIATPRALPPAFAESVFGSLLPL